MLKEEIRINHIPAIIWGNKSDKVFVAAHGNMSSKSDFPIEILAEVVIKKGYQIISFDFPEHGDRIKENTICNAQNCVKELKDVIDYSKSKWPHISIWGNSMGAYFSLIACRDENIKQALFLSPVVDMKRIIDNMMRDFNVSIEQLKREKIITTHSDIILYWDYYCFVVNNPVVSWDTPTYILYGENDNLCELEIIEKFAQKHHCFMEIIKNSKHYFHTDYDLKNYRSWIMKNVK